MALNRFQKSIAFVVDQQNKSEDEYLLTTYIPDNDLASDTLETVPQQGFFAQFAKADLKGLTDSKVNEIFCAARGRHKKADQTFAFALFQFNEDHLNPIYIVYRTEKWTQKKGNTLWGLPHLYSLQLSVEGKGQISVQLDRMLLQLGEVKLSKQSFTTSCQLSIDLESGKAIFDFVANKEFFVSLELVQVFHYAQMFGYPGGYSPESSPLKISLLNTDLLSSELSIHVKAELDLYPHYLNSSGADLTAIYLKRTRISAIPQEVTNQYSCLLYLNSKDTLGRQLTTALGRIGDQDYGQHFSFFPVYTCIHDIYDLDKVERKSFETVLIPQGIFPIEPAYGPEITAERRMKFGPSNTEVLQISENGGRPNLALEFIVNPAQGPGQQLSASPPTGGLLRRSLADVAEELMLGEEIVKKYRTGSVLSSISDTVWMRFRQLDASGGVRDLFDASVPGSCTPIYSVQPDKIALYNTKSPYATKNESLGYTLEPVALGEAPVPMSFFEGHPSDNPSISPGALAEALSDHRLWLRKSNVQSIQQFYPQNTPDPNQINQLLDDIEASITPQGFEVKVAPNGIRQYVLARSGNSKAELAELIVTDPNLSILFQKDSYFFVFPKMPGITVAGNVNIGSWPFDLTLRETSLTSSGAQEENSPPTPVVVLKFMQGKLRDLLSKSSSWSNTIAENLETKLENDLSTWLDTIDKYIDKPAFSLISKVIDDPGWAGVLFIYPSINLNSLPDELKSLVAGIDIEAFRGHHLGFPQNKISFQNGCPKIENSSFFGVIEYNSSANQPSKNFDFVVKSLQVLFNNSEVKDFNCDLEITIPNWLDENVSDINDKSGNSFKIKGRYQATRDANNQKVVRYSFVNESPIKLTIASIVCEEVCINRVELRLKSSTDSSFVTEVVLDAVAKFSNTTVPANLLEIDQFELSGISIPITNTKKDNKWIKNVGSLSFDGLAIGEQKYKKDKTPQLPIKFRRIRFFTSQKSLGEFGFSSLGNSNSQFKYGMEWDVDFGGLAKMLGLDSKLKGSLIVGWIPSPQGDICLGIRFDDMGGDKLDIGIGSLLRLKANTFSFGKVKHLPNATSEQPYILASDLKVILFGEEFPKDDKRFGLVLMPNPGDPLHGPLGWLTSVKSDKPIGPVKDLKVAIGQNLKYTGKKTTPNEITTDVVGLADFQVSNENNGPKINDNNIETFLGKLQYCTGNDWFLAFSGGTSSGITGCAVYNPPSLLGGQVGTKNLMISLLYRQETPRLGTYTGTLLLSPKIGSIDAGPIKIQLHKIEVKADTDGGYSINIGLNEAKPDDFSKAAGAEVGVYKGDVALLIANINGAAIQRIPKYKNTVIYTPASRIMMAGRFGLGRSFKKGILSAQASITFYGTFEGLIAERDLSNVPNGSNQPNPNKLPSQYFLIQAEVGIIAEVQGVVNFGVMRSRLDARLQIGFGCVLEMWKGADVYLRAELSINLHFEITPRKNLPFGLVIPAIKIHLKFSTSYEEKFKLIDDKSEEYRKYFDTGLQALPEEASGATSQLRDTPDWSTTPDVSQKIPIPLYLTLDSTFNDEMTPILVPLVVVPRSQSNSFHRDQSSQNPFLEIVSFIFEWSLNALFQQPPETISRVDLLECERRVSSAKTIWDGDFAWDIFLKKFAFQLSIPPTKNHQVAEQTHSGTVFVLPGPFDVTITYTDTNNSKSFLLGEKEVSTNYLQKLDEFFDQLRMSFEDSEDTLFPEATSERLLLLFLYEEYLTSLLRSIWMSLVAEINGGQTANFTVNELKEVLGKKIDFISGLVNRQFFSGARVPSLSNDILKSKTQSLWEAVNLTLPVNLLKSAQSLTINATALGPDTAPVIFQASASEGPVQDSLDSELDNPPTAPSIESFKQLQPFNLTKIRHPLFESIPIQDTKVCMWHLPMPLCLKAEQSKVSVKLLSIENNPSNSTILRIAENLENTIPFTPYALIQVPLSVGSEALVLQAMKESDRRLLRKVREDVDDKITTIRFFVEEIVDGQILKYCELPDAQNCWIARVNLSTDPNPTSNQFQFFQDSTELFAVQSNSVKPFLELLQLAAETNSGGYFFYNDKWLNISAERIVVAIGFPPVPTSDLAADYLLPAYINWIEAAAPDSGHVYLLEEKDSIPVPVGHPGVLSAELIRPHPQTTYRDPGRPNSPRTLHREQALAILEYMNHGHCSGILREQDRLGFLPDDVLVDASVDEVRLDSRFNLLEMTIINDGEFKELSGETDLPTPPCQKDGLDDSDLIYHWSIPAYKRVNKSENDLLPDQRDDFIYGTIGKKLTISPGFRDVLGFRPTQQDPNSKSSLTLNSNYFDPLIRWSELKGMKVNHYLDHREMKLVVQLHFTPSNPVGEALITDKMSPYLLAMQQIRDRNVEFAIRSSLQTHVLADNDRKELYKFLQSCPSLKKDKSFPIEVPLTALEATPQVADVYFAHIQICRTNKDLIWKELQEGPAYKATLDLPIGTEGKQLNKDNLIKDFVSSLETIYEKINKDRVCIATTHNSLGAVKFYILNRGLLDLPQPKEFAFAALKPISTNPYAKAKARIWDGETLFVDSINRKEKEIDIVDFDQDEALNSYLQDLDLLLTPENSIKLLKDSSTLLSQLLTIKGGLADWAATRADAIYDDNDKIKMVSDSSQNLIENLSNSFKKRLARITDVDTIILAPFTFEQNVKEQLLLYGRIQKNETSLTTIMPKIEANLLKQLRKHKIRSIESLLRFSKEDLYKLMLVPESHGLTVQSLDSLISLALEQQGPSSECFLPTALERGNNKPESTLVIQLDVRNPASKEILKADLVFSIEHIRLSLDANEPIWLELVFPIRVTLGQAEIPILYKKLLRKPDISLAPPIPSQDRVEEGLPIEKNLEWSLTFDVERTRAAIQDTVKIDILYNFCSKDKTPLRREGQDLGEVLYEYLASRSIAQQSQRLPQALRYWGQLILDKLLILDKRPPPSPQPVESISESLQEKLEIYEQYEQTGGNATLQINLVRESNSDPDLFAALSYKIEGISSPKNLLDSNLPPVRLPTEGKLASCTINNPSTNEYGEYYSGRRISIGQLNVFQFENAWPAVSIKRNQKILSKTVNKIFVYTTELVRLGESYTPLIIHEHVVELSQYDARLDSALLKFLIDVFVYFKSHNDEFPDFEMAWGFDSGQLDPFIKKDHGMRIYDADPIGMFPPKSTNYNGLKDQIKVVMGSLEKWEKENTNSTRPQNGRYVFKLRVYSRLSQLEKPILVFNNLSYSF